MYYTNDRCILYGRHDVAAGTLMMLHGFLRVRLRPGPEWVNMRRWWTFRLTATSVVVWTQRFVVGWRVVPHTSRRRSRFRPTRENSSQTNRKHVHTNDAVFMLCDCPTERMAYITFIICTNPVLRGFLNSLWECVKAKAACKGCGLRDDHCRHC